MVKYTQKELKKIKEEIAETSEAVFKQQLELLNSSVRIYERSTTKEDKKVLKGHHQLPRKQSISLA